MYPSLASFRWSRRGQRPYLVAPHGMLDPWAVSRAVWKKRLVAWWFEDAHLSGAACLHALAGSEAHAIRSYGLDNPICVIPSGVDLPTETQPAPPGWARAAGRIGRSFCSWVGCTRRRGCSISSAPGRRFRRPSCGGRGLAACDRRLESGQPGGDVAAPDRRARRRHDRLPGRSAVRRPQGRELRPRRCVRAALLQRRHADRRARGVVLRLAGADDRGVQPPEGFAAGAALQVGPDRAGIGVGLRQLFAMSDAARRDMGARGRALARTLHLGVDRRADGRRIDGSSAAARRRRAS